LTNYFDVVIYHIKVIIPEEDFMERSELEALALDIMGRADMVALATIGPEPYPQVRALFNLRDARRFPSLASYQADKGLSIYLGTNTSSVKLREIGAEPWVSVYYMIPAEFKGLCLSGKARADPEARAALWVEGWEMYYPAGREDPDYTVLRVDPLRAKGWSSAAAFDLEL
jgi:general stress protein 26